ncbi:zinc finger protein 25-like isoform X5 [Neodiprion virginianus]|uniref:zinc finger protein 25-like isoform X5 n=1 Tax=Neodiprion virginianus TaxID=2961670 RepID=UPI001EE77958|nr:zinc finger protein 25-like isoform X5 [Neodiprion virginianus]
MSSLDYLDLCRLCLMKDRVSVPIFEGEGDVRQIFLKIAACLPVKVAREDKLPKKICDDCVYKVELLYQFWNTTANAEKQLLQWLGEVGLEDKQGYVTGVLNPSTMKQEENSSSGLGGTAIQVTGVQPGIGIGVIDNMGLGMPLIIPSSTQQELTAVPMDTSTGPIQPIQPIQQAVPGPSSQPGHEQIAQSQTNATTHQQDEEEETSDDEENSDDDCDGDDGLPVKEESEEDPSNSRTIEPTTFVNVSLACDEAGPSGLQQQKIVEMPEMAMPQTTDGDPKSGYGTDVKLPFVGKENESASCIRLCLEESNVGPTRDSSVRQSQPLRVQDLLFTPLVKEEVTVSGSQVLSINALIGHIQVTKRCDICNKIFINEQYLAQHKLVHANGGRGSLLDLYQCKECKKIFKTKKDCNMHLSKTHSSKHLCNRCPKMFRTAAGREVHLNPEHKKPKSKPVRKCTECNFTSSELTKFRAHRKVHYENRDFYCEYCDFKTKNNKSLRTHVRLHTNEYSLRCDICSKGFLSQKVLDRHRITHTGERPFTCQVCNSTYADRRSLQLHSTSHDPQGREKKYHCEVCGYSSFWKGAVRVHMKVHTGVKVICHICGQAVSSNHYLSIHMRIHTGEKPYECDICHKGFRQLKNLLVHCRTHTGEKPYECKYCRKSFSQKTSLKNHKCKPLV